MGKSPNQPPGELDGLFPFRRIADFRAGNEIAADDCRFTS
jgi:hypothetical protein